MPGRANTLLMIDRTFDHLADRVGQPAGIFRLDEPAWNQVSDLGDAADTAGNEWRPAGRSLPEHGGQSFGAAGQHEQRRGPIPFRQLFVGFRSQRTDLLLKLKTSDLSLQSILLGPLSDHETGESHPISLEMRARLDQHVEALDGEQVTDEQDDRNVGWKPQTPSSLRPRTGPENLPVDSGIDDMNVPGRGT